MPVEPFGIAAGARRLKADGKHTLKKVETETSFQIFCKKCEFHTPSVPKALSDLVNIIEKSAYEHISQPDLLISGTSDIGYAMRMAIRDRDLGRL